MQNLNVKTWAIQFLILALFSGGALALDSDREANIVIEGPGCVTNFKSQQTECQKGLSITQGSLLIQSAYGLIHHQSKQVSNVLMKGQPVYMEQMLESGDKMIIKAEQVDYKKDQDKVFLDGDVSIQSGIGLTTGQSMIFDLNTQEITSNGDEEDQPFQMVIDQNND